MFDVIIIGSGPAGLTAAIYTSRAALKTLVLAGKKWGGQLMLTTEVENFPGFPEGILGPKLMMAIRKQAEKFGAEIIDKEAVKVDFSKRPFKVYTSGAYYQANSIIIATGADTLWLNIPGEQRLIGKGVSSCAPCDAFFFKNKKVIVVGGGDSAMEEALVLAKFASLVTIIHRKDQFRASKIMQKKVFKNAKIDILWKTTVEEIIGKEKVARVRLKSTVNSKQSTVKIKNKNVEKTVKTDYFSGKIIKQKGGELIWEMPIEGVFVAIGHLPNSRIFQGQIELDEKGYIKKITNYKLQITNKEGKLLNNKYKTMTSVEGVFAAGDVHDYHYKQAITAAGYGTQAALDAEKWLEKH